MEQGDSRLVTQYCPDSVYVDLINIKRMPQSCNIHTDHNRIIKENKQGETDW